MKLLLVLALGAVAFASSPKPPLRFDGFKVFRITPQSDAQVDALRNLEENSQGFNFWTEVAGVGKSVDIMVPPHLRYNFEDLVDLQKLDAQVWIENVQELIDNQTPKAISGFNWEDYQTLDQIYAWLDELVEKFPDVVSPIVGGKSYEGREIRGVKVSFKAGNKGVFIEGGIHAREWIAPATVTFLLNEFLTSTNSSVREIAESRDWHIFPSVNPDGYVYTHEKDRMWRKTRQPYPNCFGADPNRNWDYHWMDGGASASPCSETHAGSAPFSEIETKSLSEYISSVAPTLDTYLAFHSYSQILLLPFGHKGLEVPENNDELHTIALNAKTYLSVRYGTQYTYGNIPQAIYIASGGSMDWAVGVHRNIRIAITYELRDTGRYGFLLPPNQIIPTALETLDSIVSIIRDANK